MQTPVILVDSGGIPVCSDRAAFLKNDVISREAIKEKKYSANHDKSNAPLMNSNGYVWALLFRLSALLSPYGSGLETQSDLSTGRGEGGEGRGGYSMG